MSYTYNPIYTHFKGKDMTRAELIERAVVETIQKSKMPDEKRAWSKTFEFKHSSSVTQFGRVLAQKRGLNQDLAAIICAMHDIYVFTTGRVTDHAHKGAPIAKKILEKTKKFTPQEIKLITTAIYNHSDKHVVSKNPHVELVKDADVFDCGLYDGVHDAYLYEKSHDNCNKYFARIKAVRKELGLPKDPQWDIFEYVERGKDYYAKRKNWVKLPFDPKGDIFRWGAVPGKFFYLSVFTEVHYKHFRKKYGENWSETIWLFKDGRMLWLNDTKEVEEAGRKVFVRYQLPKALRQKIYVEWQSYVKSLNQFYKKIEITNLADISNQALLKFWNDFHNLYIKFWVSGSVPELANYGSIPYLEEKLLTYIPNPTERAAALEILTAPTKLSFYQEEEIDLAKTNKLAAHQKKYFWLKNSYAGTTILPVNFFKQRKKTLTSNLEQVIAKKLRETIKKKKELQKKYRLPKEIIDIAEAISSGVAWQDERKKYIFIALHFTDLLAKEIARRFNYKFKDFENLWYFEVGDIIKGKNLHKQIKERKKSFGVQFFHTCKQFSPSETDYVWRAYEVEHKNAQQIELKGIIASKGNGKKITAPIHILLDPSKTKIFKQGEILVAPMTSPEYIFAMRKASAILTDTGGLTSHAIVSRELGVPCLVGTKLATKVFKNGDLVEVDPQNGIAKKLK